MAAPWEKYATATAEAPDPADSPLPPWKRHAQAQGPWSRYQGAAPAGASPKPSSALSGQDAESSFAEIADVSKVNAAANRGAGAVNKKIAETLEPVRAG